MERLTYISTTVGAGVVQSLIQVLSNAAVTASWEGDLITPAVGAPQQFTYNSVGDVLALDCSGGGVGCSIFMPAPKLGLLLVDSQTYDPTSGPGTLLDAAILIGGAVPLTMTPITAVNAGRVLRRASGIRETYQGGAPGPPINRASVVWGDTFGRTTMQILTCFLSCSVLMSTMQTWSNAQIIQYWEGHFNTYILPTPGAGDFPSVKTYADLIFQDDRGSLGHIIVPAPVIGMFLADTETVDQSNSDVAALITAVLALCVCPGSGRSLASYVSGMRRELKGMGLAQGPV
jgi:hypothetical protein